ncbi:MAG: 16S rRNA methyltransferase [Acidobacteriales bacterium 13_2_20CM_55_8]|jgi:16S rRNA (uracil1498-N3)-methyltransferase|nr:MAG: 16S rRNA methyltransferase [Acidobacteriales bacterium 13_2_20CM_55_8]
MSRRRWIADEVSGNRAALTGEHAEHLSRVLRARVGQEFEIATGENVRRGRVTRIDPNRVEFELGDEITATASPNVTLALSIFKFDRMEWAIEKCTELGATRIVPVIASRTETHLAAAASKRVERWQRIARQASEQSRRYSPPQIDQPMKVPGTLALPGNTRIVLAESEQQVMLREVLHHHSARDLVLAFGPEGGWIQSELELFRNAGWISASLGNTILRVETAAIAALAVTLSELA